MKICGKFVTEVYTLVERVVVHGGTGRVFYVNRGRGPFIDHGFIEGIPPYANAYRDGQLVYF